MAQKPPQDTSTTLIETTSEAAATAPPWFATAVVVLRTVRASALWQAVCDLHVARGRAGAYVALDFVLVLLTFAVADAPHLKALFAEVPPIAALLVAVWGRE